MTDTDMLYVAALEKENAALKQRIAELEERHFNECAQIAHYSDELAKAKELLKAAVEDFPDITDGWRYAHKVLKFFGEDINVPATATDTNVGGKGGNDNA